MANTKISSLAAGSAVAATDVFPAVETTGVGPVQKTAAQLKTFMSGAPLTLASGTITTSAPALTQTQTWNAGAVAFTGSLLNVTDTASASGSLLLDMQVGGTSKASIRKDGNVSAAGFSASGSVTWASAGGGGDTSYVYTPSLALTNGTTAFATDVRLTRDAANTLALRNGTASQTLNLYESYTDASNNSKVGLTYSSGVSAFLLQNQQAGTGTARDIGIYNSAGYGWLFKTGGSSSHLLANIDNASDIGASGANRPRNLYVGTSATIGGTTVTTSAPAINASQTWNAAGVAFTGSLLNVTDTASAAGSLLADWQVGGTSKFKVDKAGAVTIAGPSGGGVTLATYDDGGASLKFVVSGNNRFVYDTGFDAFFLRSFSFFGWSSGDPAINGPDVRLWRDAANTLALRNGTNAQTSRVYNTYTDASNGEWGTFDWTTNANVLTIGTKSNGTGSVRPIQFVFGSNTAGFQLGAGNTTPIFYVATATGKAGGFIAGSAATEFLYDSSGPFSIARDGKSNIVNGTSSGGTAVLTFDTNAFATFGATIKTNIYTVATLPAAATVGAGARAFVTDANATTYASIVAGSGTNKVPVYSDGTNWLIG